MPQADPSTALAGRHAGPKERGSAFRRNTWPLVSDADDKATAFLLHGNSDRASSR
ncbi:Hypothetical protein CAP_8295 [Chondromyces apiculatus DSM 436]|uniref:Uncharacterized protein n=1 Tax=Chondromyces apiculatus DSM 436 TaxID=1192034 RepID=A0A017SXH2_9BACT|nr:Hypothetical protein CAP_8295 [Chondromyces apiculatus DSM 436]